VTENDLKKYLNIGLEHNQKYFSVWEENTNSTSQVLDIHFYLRHLEKAPTKEPDKHIKNKSKPFQIDL
jgi:hypothetical protein